MLRRLFALAILVVLVGAAFVFWQRREGGFASAPQVRLPGDLGEAAREGRERLGRVGAELSDAKTTASVKAALALDRDVAAYSIDVDSEGGVVTLRGRVAGEAARAAATRVASSVPGVERVVDQLSLDAPAAPASGERSIGESLDDRALEAKVELALSLNREMHGADVDARAFRKGVTLTGRVLSAEQHERALHVARQVPGVAAVTDQLQVGGAAGGAETGGGAAEVAQALAANSHLGRYGIRAEEQGGRIVLRGRVGSAVEKDLAGAIARETARGRPVDNALEVGAPQS